MPVGFEARTESGNVIQIDENYPVLCLRYTGSATVVNRHPASLNASSFIAKTVDITVTGESPQFFIQSNGGRFGVIAVSQTGNQWTFRVIGFEDQPTFTYFIFDRPIVTASGAAALEVRNAQNQVVFSSLWRPMVVAGFTTGNQTAQLPSGRAYAYGFGSRITLQEYSETFTDQSVWTYWTYRLATASAAAQPGSSAIYGTVFDDAIAGGVNQGGQSPVSPSGALGGWGADSTLTVIDVTDLVGAPGGTTAPVVSVNTTFRTVTGAGGTTITDAVTCSASGGAGGPYSFLWDKVGGDSAIVFYGASNTASMRTQWVNQPAGTSAQAQFRCRVTDAGGNVTYSQPVTFEHKQTANSATPAPLNLTDQAFATNDFYGAVSVSRTITGINQSIIIRASTSQVSGNLSAGGIYFRKNGAAHPSGVGIWTSGAVSREWTFSNGDSFEVFIDAQTASGARSGRVYVTLTNVSTGASLGGFWVQCDVDVDNNYNLADYTPNAISVPNLGPYTTNSHELSTEGRFFQITGINRQIWLRFIRTFYELTSTGNIETRRLQIFHSTVGSGGPWTQVNLGAGTAANPTPYVDVACNNGDWFYVQGYITTAQGRATVSWPNYIDFHDGVTVLGRLATFTISATLDNDDNYYVVDRTLNPMNWGDTTASDNGPQVAAGNGYLTLSGINQPISVRYAVVGGTSHNFTGGGVQFYKNGAYQGEIGLTVNANVTHHNLVNGDQISFVGYGSTTSGKRQGSICVHVVNASTEEFIDAFWFHLTADADDNYNTSSAPSLTFKSTYVYKNEFAWSGQNYGVWSDPGAINVTVNGGQGPFTYAWTKLTDTGGSWNVNGTTQPQFYCAGYTTFQHYATWRLIVTDALGRTAQGIVEVTIGAGDQA